MKSDYPIKIIGARHGEKLYESLLSKEERYRSIETKKYFKIMSDTRDLNYENYFHKGSLKISKNIKDDEYNSHNTTQLSVNEMVELLKSDKNSSLYA